MAASETPHNKRGDVFAMSALSVRYGRTTALAEIDLSIARGSSVALVGPNGCGKSTLLNVLAGLQKPSEGSMSASENSTVAYVLQHGTSERWMPLSVDEILAMGRYPHLGLFGRFGPTDRTAIDDAAQRLDIADLRQRQFGELSGGQQQRVLVAQALAQQADVLLLDEPITGLDMASQHRILDVIDSETAGDRTVVLSTHHLEEAHHCDWVAVMATRLVAFGHPADVLTTETLREAYDHVLFGAHVGHDHPRGPMLIDDAHHEHDHSDFP